MGIAVTEGVTQAERDTGIPKTTIQYWTHDPEFAQLRTTAREVVAEQFWMGIQIGIAQVAQGLAGDAPLRDKADATVKLLEKYLLLKGEATTRSETRDLTEHLPDHERQALADAVDAWLRETADDLPSP